ncbi:MAG: RNA polymerase sigma factor [Saprospiraceae bacterium]
MPLDNEKNTIELLRSENVTENDQGLKILYQQFFPMISHLIQRNSGGLEDVEDLFQDGILVLFNQVKKNDFVLTCKLRTYFYSICRNLWLNKLNQRKTDIVDIQDHESFIVIEPTIFKSIEVNEEKEAMLKLIGHLGEDCQKMLTYFYYERIKMKEIAIRMNFANDQVARNKKVKCLKKLTSIIDQSPFFTRFFK